MGGEAALEIPTPERDPCTHGGGLAFCLGASFPMPILAQKTVMTVMASVVVSVWATVPVFAEEESSVGSIDFEKGRKFWSFQPVKKLELPPVPDDWVKNRVDRFVQARMRAEGLQPSPAADRRVLIRRLSYDLIGLPPSPEEVESFISDQSEGAYLRVVDRLLASPHYGERWGRAWLDLARYADIRERWVVTHGSPYHYRDWVVRALNEDMPYDQFAKRQLATDLMDETGLEDMPALGFLGISPVYHKELLLAPQVIRMIVAEEWEERIDTVGRTFLGLTISCARCHDHKFDPIDSHDYYALAGVFASIRRSDRACVPDERARVADKARKEVEKLEKEAKGLRDAKSSPPDRDEQLVRLEERIRHLKEFTPNYDHLVPAVVEASIHVVGKEGFGTKLDYRSGMPRDLRLQMRGDPATLGSVVPRRFLRVLSPGEPKAFTQGSGRLELANCIFDEGASLSARVMVNRVWLQHFGRGLVATPSDFGTQGERPSHPGLLDDLAARFIEEGWSLKWLHRELVTSATYQQSVDHRPEMARRDPHNKWLWRMNRRRLEVEAWRDAMLTVTGQLVREVGGAPLDLSRADNYRRTIYGRIDRRDLEPLLQIHDFPDPDAHSPAREKTITPLQQLFVLNGQFFRQQAEALVSRLYREAPESEEARIGLAHELLYGRPSTGEEVGLARSFLELEGASDRENWKRYAQALFGSNEFLFVD